MLWYEASLEIPDRVSSDVLCAYTGDTSAFVIAVGSMNEALWARRGILGEIGRTGLVLGCSRIFKSSKESVREAVARSSGVNLCTIDALHELDGWTPLRPRRGLARVDVSERQEGIKVCVRGWL